MANPINPIYPVTDVRSIDQLMAIAVGVEHQAAIRYQQLAEAMERRGDVDLAGTFRRLSALELVHEAGLSAWARREGRPPPEPALFAWSFPENFAWEDATGQPPTPYQALAIAVRNEEQAFSFYTYLAAEAVQLPEIRQRAEALAREELSHIAQLRRLRRQAYHAPGNDRRQRRITVSTLGELRHLADQLEGRAAQLAHAAADCLDRQGHPGPAKLLRQNAPAACPPDDPAAGAPLSVAEALGHCETDTRGTLETYLVIAERARDENLLHAAQDLAEGAMARLAIITNCPK